MGLVFTAGGEDQALCNAEKRRRLFVMDMRVRVLDRLVGMFMFVMLGQMQPNAKRHNHSDR